ncbi:MAG TPA: hypothetical protein VM943_03830 [Pyrinomonadaceae bacterium]|nr:hypothetical protein [Pyrinomonadaceae bacterium]
MKVDVEKRTRMSKLRRAMRSGLIIFLVAACVACNQIGEKMSVRPRSLRDVPAERLAFRFEPDFDAEALPALSRDEEPEEPLAPVRTDFETRRAEERLVRTVVSPDGQRALALYETIETPQGDFRMDLYAADGRFIRNILPPDLSGAFAPTVAWSPDGQQIAFIGIKNSAAQASPTPTPFDPVAPAPPGTEGTTPAPSPDTMPTVAPLIPPVPAFGTEQIYVGDRDGFSLRPLTTRDGLIYFQFTWAPDAHAIAALACKEDEWNARRTENKTPAGRPRLLAINGGERLLSDSLAEATPAWSPDSSKVATSFETDVAIYDALGETPTAAMIPLRELLLASSLEHDARMPQKPSTDTANKNSMGKAGGDVVAESSPAESPSPAASLSFNPVVRLEWLQPETLLVQTAFLRVYKTEPVKNYPRWHVLHLSPQAAVLTYRRQASSSSFIASSANCVLHTECLEAV